MLNEVSMKMLASFILMFAVLLGLATFNQDLCAEEVKEGRPKTLGESLDRRYRFSKKFQSEVVLFGGNFVADEWKNTWDAGAKYYFHINNDFALGAVYRYSPIRTDGTGVFGGSLKTKNTHMVNGEVMYSNDCAFRAGDSIVECDLFITAGAGAMSINEVWEAVGVIGGGMKIYTPIPFFAVRFDVDSTLHYTPKPTGASFTSDIILDLGVSFLFPVKKAENAL